MTEIEGVARKWGNSVGIIIPWEITQEERIVENEKLFISIKKRHKVKEFFGILAGEWNKPTQELKDEMRKGWQ